MEMGGRTVLLCDCGGSLPLDGAALARACGTTGVPAVARELCRTQAGRVVKALATGAPLLIACTQEMPLFEALRAAQAPDTVVHYANIRERAGWSDEGARALPKMAALLAEAVEPGPAAASLPLRSSGRTLVIGRDEEAIAAARQVADRLDVSVLLWPADTVAVPALDDVPVFRGQVTGARGHLGAFSVTVRDYAPVIPSGRGAARFGAAETTVLLDTDLILDLTGGPALFRADDRRDGYRRADPDRPAEVQRALLDVTALTGEFEQPRHLTFTPALCAHSRNRKTGCSRCVDLCPTGAVTPGGEDAVVLDAYVCGGCGSCAAVCPTGAASYALPPDDVVLRRLHRLLTVYRQAGGTDPVILFHDDRHGSEVIAALARHGRGLPARVIPVALNEVSRLSLDALAAALAWGATRVRVLPPAGDAPEIAAVAGQIALLESLLEGLGLEHDRVGFLHGVDPDTLADALYALPGVSPPGLAPPGLAPLPAAGFLPLGNRRTLLRMALDHLRGLAPTAPAAVALPADAPFGQVVIDTAGCTLCLACAGACPTQALRDHPDRPSLGFVEDLCIQCGLCRQTCPEKVVTLAPRYAFGPAAREVQVLKEEEPFACIQCGKPFGTRGIIERVIEKLAGTHGAFSTPAAIDRLKMCEDCRIVAEIESPDTPLSFGARPKPRTADDYR